MAQTVRRNTRGTRGMRNPRNRGTRRGRRKQNSSGRRFVVVIIVITLVCVAGYFVVKNFGKAQRVIENALYPLKYSEYVDKASADYDVDKALVYAMIRTESHFQTDVVSTAGAIGLMQLTPETYEWLCEKRDIVYDGDDLYDPASNIDFGTYYISWLFGEFGDEELVIAAYNAGPDNVKKWLKDPDYSPDGVTLENIPYAETEKHVEKVLDAEDKYKKLYFSQE